MNSGGTSMKMWENLYDQENFDASYAELVELRGEARELLRESKRYAESIADMAAASERFAGMMNRIAKRAPMDSVLSRFGSYFSTSLRVVSTFIGEMGKSIDALHEDMIGTFTTFDFAEVTELKKKKDKAKGDKERDLEAKFADSVSVLQEKTETHVMKALLESTVTQGTYFDKCTKIFTNLDRKVAELKKIMSDKHYRPVAKEGVVTTKNGKKVFLTLTDGVFKFFHDEKDHYQKGCDVDSTIITIKLPPPTVENSNLRFEVHCPHFKTPYIFFAETEAERDEWVKAFQLSVSNSLNRLSVQITKASPMKAKLDEMLTPRANQRGDGLPYFCGNEKVGQSLDTNYIAALMAKEGNCECAECGAKNPEWASINLGILLCLECSGVHRSLGTHISKVRSFNLDRWTAPTLMIVNYIGNKMNRSLYESDFPADGQRLDPSSDFLTRDAFIGAKYRDRKFCISNRMHRGKANRLLFDSSCNHDPMTAFHGCVRAMVAGANVNYASSENEGRTAIIEAVVHGNVCLLEYLLQNGADAFACDSRGWNTLHYAAHYNRPHCFLRICQMVKNDEFFNGISPLEIAEENQSEDILLLLSEEVEIPELPFEMAFRESLYLDDTGNSDMDEYTTPAAAVPPPVALETRPILMTRKSTLRSFAPKVVATDEEKQKKRDAFRRLKNDMISMENIVVHFGEKCQLLLEKKLSEMPIVNEMKNEYMRLNDTKNAYQRRVNAPDILENEKLEAQAQMMNIQTQMRNCEKDLRIFIMNEYGAVFRELHMQVAERKRTLYENMTRMEKELMDMGIDAASIQGNEQNRIYEEIVPFDPAQFALGIVEDLKRKAREAGGSDPELATTPSPQSAEGATATLVPVTGSKERKKRRTKHSSTPPIQAPNFAGLPDLPM